MEYDAAIVGGGASGLAAAAAAAREGAHVILLEAQPRVGKKLLATGNGRCNLSNQNACPQRYHGDAAKMEPVLSACPPQAVTQFFSRLGLLCREQDDGRLYPYSLQAASVLDVLRAELTRLGVTQRCECPVREIRKTNNSFLLYGSGEPVRARRVVLAAGGMAYPQLGANGSGYELARALGHSVSPVFPALAPFNSEPARVRPLHGARSTAQVSLLRGGREIHSARGEVQFTEYGLSGICIFDLSRFVGKPGSGFYEVSLDLMPEYTADELVPLLRGMKSLPLPGLELMSGCLHKAVGREVVRTAVKRVPQTVSAFSEDELCAVARTVKSFRFPVTGVRGWNSAQVTAGGVPLAELRLPSMESVRCPGLYVTGELLNIDGDCGGFNLHWAFATGLLAGRYLARQNSR